MTSEFSRRQILSTAGLAAAGLLGASAPRAAAAPTTPAATKAEDFTYCFNTSTIRGQKLPLDKEVELVAKAGYQAIEPWINEIRDYQRAGGSLADLRKKIADLGLTVESSIGFAPWIIDDDEKRKKGLSDLQSDMDLVKQIGGKRIAAPPAGATDQANLNLLRAAERYRAALEVGVKMEITPQVEVWGFSKCLSRLGETALVAIEAQHPQACILPDVYHLYKGGSDFQGLKMIDGRAIQVFHMNDYPADYPRDKIKDADRVYPTDGVAPLKQILRDLMATGFRGVLSLELFNPEYYKQDPAVVVKTGLEKMKGAVSWALEGG